MRHIFASESFMFSIYFNSLIARYFYNLHTLSDSKGSILYLSALFENLVKQKDPQLYFHMAFELDIQPLEIAFKWILYAFVGILEIGEVLLMWDRLIAYNSTDILALTAASLFCYRRDQLFQCKTIAEARVRFPKPHLRRVILRPVRSNGYLWS